jgi:glucuronoarabinoxylan endo-1,4-beta-xylanase
LSPKTSLAAIILAAFLASSLHADGVIDPYVRYQQIEGFGAAGAWYNGWLTAHPKKNELYSLLFGQLSLDIYRIRNTYQIDNPSMSTDATIINAANATLARPLKIMLSSWSPPASLKSTGSTAGGTLAKDTSGNYRYADFASWWVGSLGAYAAVGITPYYLNMQNEPDYVDTWDTCKFAPTENSTYAGYSQAFAAFATAVNASSYTPKLLAPEGAGFGVSGGFIDALTNKSAVYAYAHHLYGDGNGNNPDGYISGMTSFAAKYSDKPRMQTEFSNTGDTGTFNDAILLAILMHNSLTVENVSVYMYWDLFWGSSGGLITLDNPWGSNPGYTINPVYYAFKHYSAFIEPGWRRISASSGNSSLRISAYASSDYSSITAVIINSTTSAQPMTLGLRNFSFTSGSVYRSSASEHAVLVGSFVPSQAMSIPASSITTITASGAFSVPALAPDPMTWSSAPAGVSLYTISMTATQVTAGTPSPEYYFHCVSGGGHDSGWRTSRTYNDAGLSIGTTYGYTVKAREGSNTARETAASAVAYASTMALPLPVAMEAWWPLNETAGLDVLDMTTNCNDGLVQGLAGPSASWTDGRFGGALDLTGGGSVRIASSPSTNFANESMSISFWMKAPATIPAGTTQHILLKGTYGGTTDGGDGKRYEFFRRKDAGGTDSVYMVVSDGTTTSPASISSGLACTGQWVHIVAVRDKPAGWLTLYVNGTLGTTVAEWSSDLSNDEPLFFASGGMTGALDDVRIYRKALSEMEVTALYLGSWNVDDAAPIPSPMSFAIAPHAASASAISMTASSARDQSGVEYYFACTSGSGHDSAWQDGPIYTDTGLANNASFAYKVMARDKSSSQYSTQWSDESAATTLHFDCPQAMLSDLDSSCQVDFLDLALLASRWGSFMPPSVEISVNGTFDSPLSTGWQWFDLPSATGSCMPAYDDTFGNPIPSAYLFSDNSAGTVGGHYLYQVLPAKEGASYRFSGQWAGDLNGTFMPDPLSNNNWAEVLVSFQASPDPNTWSWTAPGAVAYRKEFGPILQNVDSTGYWDWQEITASSAGGPSDGVFTSTGTCMVVAFSLGGKQAFSGPWFSIDNIKVEGPGCPDIDLNNDCKLDILDIQQFALDYLSCRRQPSDQCWQ